ncbi:hypothetical protein OC845_000655 [Tilletia horrida]|nr:hypothetical protein OC845_000655 [Tilletia horrida]
MESAEASTSRSRLPALEHAQVVVATSDQEDYEYEPMSEDEVFLAVEEETQRWVGSFTSDEEEQGSSTVPYIASQLVRAPPSSAPHIPRTLADVAAFQAAQVDFAHDRSPSPAPTVPLPSQSPSFQSDGRISSNILLQQRSLQLIPQHLSPEVVIPIRQAPAINSSQGSSSSELSDLTPEFAASPLQQDVRQEVVSAGAADAPPSPRTAAALEAAQREQFARQQRSLRTRNPSQLNPYQIEAQRYAAALLRNDWEDALVGQRSVRMQEKRRVADEDREAQILKVAPTGADDETQDWLIDDMPSSDESAYTEVSDGNGGKKRQRSVGKSSAAHADKENLSPEEREARRQRAEAKRRRREEREVRARVEAESARIHHPGVKRARPIAPPLRPRSPPRVQSPREDLSYLLPQSDDELDLISPPSNVFSPGPRRPLPAFMRNGSGPALGEEETDSDSSEPVFTGVKRKAHRSPDHAIVSADRDARHRQNSEDSDSDAEYRRLFKHLRRMMPFHMARKHIEDVKNMRKGKAYHSDGHVSSTPEPSSEEERDRSSPNRIHQRSTPASSPPPDAESLRPGEARKRTGPRTDDEAGSSRYALVGDSQSSSSGAESAASVISISSDDEGPNRHQNSDTDVSERDDISWTRPTAALSRPRAGRRPKDSIDMLLSRAGGRRKNKAPKRSRGSREARYGQPQFRQAKLDGVTARRMPAGFGKGMDGHKAKASRSGDRPAFKRMRQSRLQVEREERPAVDLLDDDILFEFDMPAHRDFEFAFLDPPADDATAARDGQSRSAQPGTEESPMVGMGAAQMSSPHGYFMQPIGPLTPSTTASTFLMNADRQQPRPQPIHVVPPLPAVGRPQGTSSSSSTEPSHLTGLMTPSRPVQSEYQTGSAARSASSGIQHMDAETWGTYRRLRVDFGIQPLPFGLRFGASSYLSRGRLAQVLQAADQRPRPSVTGDEDSMRSVYAMGIELSPSASVLEITEQLPSLFDAMAVAILPDQNDASTSSLGLRSTVEDALRFLGRYLSDCASETDADQYATLWQALKSHLSRTCDRVQVMAKLGSEAHATAALALRWFAVEYAWRALLCKQPSADAPFAQIDFATELSFAAQQLMLHLLKHGLHRTFKAVREATNSKDDNAMITDLTAELWVCLVHLLRSQGTFAPEVERMCSFWSIFDGANKLLVDRGVGRQRLGASERSWYSIFAICALSQFGPANGMTGNTPALPPNWSLVTFALSLVRFRFDEKPEKTMSSTSIQRRDTYIRVVLQRCLTLATKWHWQLDNAELALSKLFDIFNSHKLCNLPSEIERTHDYPAFLCKYDESYLKEIAPEDLGEGHGHGRPLVFHLFVKLLSKAAYDLRAAAVSPADAERRVSRLFSRMSPVRTMPFTNTSPPTSIERSILFNHYTMVLLYLHFVPSAANQRLRQIKSFLPFAGADIASQMTCVRAMLYVGVLFRHHDLPLQPVTAWFSEALPMLVQQHEALERQRLSGSKTGPYKDWTATALYRELRSTSTLLIAALRAIQHVLKHPSLDQSKTERPLGYPDLQLLQADWVKTVLEGQVAVDPAIGREAMNTIQEFLKQRNQVIAASQAPKQRSAAAATTAAVAGDAQEESQDSFAGMFDDVDMLMDDPVLASMLGEIADSSEASAAQTTLNAKDTEFAALIKSTISPALFRLLSNVYHPDRAKAGERISLSYDDRLLLSNLHRSLREQRLMLEQQRNRQRYVELVVDCWAGCADVLVRNGLRDWDKYFSSFGDESWKRISDPIGRRDVGLRFLHTALLRDPAAYEMYEGEFVSMWFQSSVSRLLSIQDRYTRTLIEIDGDGPFFRNMPWARDPETGGVAKLKDTDFLKLRLPALSAAFDNLSQEFARPSSVAPSKTNRKPMIFACISATVAAMRQNVEDTPMSHPDRNAYLRFCLRVVVAMKNKLGPGILRGAGAEIGSFEAHLVTLGATLPPQTSGGNSESVEQAANTTDASAAPAMEVDQQNTEMQGGTEPKSNNVIP